MFFSGAAPDLAFRMLPFHMALVKLLEKLHYSI